MPGTVGFGFREGLAVGVWFSGVWLSVTDDALALMKILVWQSKNGSELWNAEKMFQPDVFAVYAFMENEGSHCALAVNDGMNRPWDGSDAMVSGGQFTSVFWVSL